MAQRFGSARNLLVAYAAASAQGVDGLFEEACRTTTIATLAGGAYLDSGDPVVLGESGTGKSHLLIGLGIAACEQGRQVRCILSVGVRRVDDGRLVIIREELFKRRVGVLPPHPGLREGGSDSVKRHRWWNADRDELPIRPLIVATHIEERLEHDINL